jgi:hypothetical protein
MVVVVSASAVVVVSEALSSPLLLQPRSASEPVAMTMAEVRSRRDTLRVPPRE